MWSWVIAVLGVGVVATACSGPFDPRKTSIAIEQTDIRAVRLLQPELSQPLRDGGLAATSVEEIVKAARAGALSAERATQRARRVDAAQAPLLVETAPGRAFLRAAPSGRALAKGAPAAHCPAIGVALNRSSAAQAAEAALTRCLQALEKTPRWRLPQNGATEATPKCGCRLMAVDRALLSEPEAFIRARAVSAVVIDSAAGVDVQAIAHSAPAEANLALSAEEDAERIDAALLGAQRLELASVKGKLGTLVLEADGSARFSPVGGGPAYAGRWRAEGFRRGRFAGGVALERPGGESLLILIGYEPAELGARRADLERAAQDLI